MRKPLTITQSVILALLWISICYLVLTSAERIDGPLVVSILISGALVFIPILKAAKRRRG